MKLLITLSLMWFSIANLQAQSISHIETTKNWYYIYDQNGKSNRVPRSILPMT